MAMEVPRPGWPHRHRDWVAVRVMRSRSGVRVNVRHRGETSPARTCEGFSQRARPVPAPDRCQSATAAYALSTHHDAYLVSAGRHGSAFHIRMCGNSVSARVDVFSVKLTR